jgi:ferric-dicitrate binding protein FerR (iron transport regulator)
MSIPNVEAQVRGTAALLLAVAILNLSVTFVFAAPASSASRAMLRASGIVTVSDLPASSGLTIFSGSRIVTAAKSAAIVELGGFSRLLLAEQTELALDFYDESVSGSVSEGDVRAFMPVAKPLTLNTPAGVVVTDSSEVVVLRVQVNDAATVISVERGRAVLRSGKETRTVLAGETLSAAGNCPAMPTPGNNLNSKAKVGLVAGIGAGLAILLFAITGDDDEEADEFGGCVIVLSPTSEPQQCH